MSNFWELSDGQDASASHQTEYEMPGGNLDPIPDGSSVLAMIDEAKWDTKDESEYISLRWTILGPDLYKNRKVYHKLFVTDFDPKVEDEIKAAKKRDRARMMLAAIDANAGGKLTAQPGKPTNESLTARLTNKPMVTRLGLWELTDKETGDLISGNWVQAVAPKNKGIDIKDAKPSKAKPAQVRTDEPAFDDEIPF